MSRHLTEEDFEDVRQRGVIGMIPGEIVTTDNGYADHVDLEKDILKIAVVERHKNTGPHRPWLHSGLRPQVRRGRHVHLPRLAQHHRRRRKRGRIWRLRQTTLSRTTAASSSSRTERSCRALFWKSRASCPMNRSTKMNEELEAAKDAAFCLGVSRGIDPVHDAAASWRCRSSRRLRITTRGVIDVIKQQYI